MADNQTKETLAARRVQKEYGLEAKLSQEVLHDHDSMNALRLIGKHMNPTQEYLGSIALHFYKSTAILAHDKMTIAFGTQLAGPKEAEGLAAGVNETIVNHGIKQLAKIIIEHYKENRA